MAIDSSVEPDSNVNIVYGTMIATTEVISKAIFVAVKTCNKDIKFISHFSVHFWTSLPFRSQCSIINVAFKCQNNYIFGYLLSWKDPQMLKQTHKHWHAQTKSSEWDEMLRITIVHTAW